MVNEYENSLRRLIIEIIGPEDSAPYKVPEERISKWIEKREISIKKNKGVSFEDRLIFYSDFYDLNTIISKNWVLFLPILINKKRFDVFFSEVEHYRNTLAHGRDLTTSQINLLNGISSDLKNLITIYHNKNETKEDCFIRINKINDNLGNIWENGKKTQIPILRVGDEYELVIDANDPKDREIEYQIFELSSGYNVIQKSNRFIIKLENNMASESTQFQVVVRTPNSEYKNESSEYVIIQIYPN